MILVDTSAWVEFDRATNSNIDQLVTNLIAQGGKNLAVTEPILMEILSGAKDEKRHQSLKRLLTSFEWIPTDPVADFEGASVVYRECRANGITPRGLIDCIIVNIAIRTNSQLLAMDKDFRDIAKIMPLQLVNGISSV